MARHTRLIIRYSVVIIGGAPVAAQTGSPLMAVAAPDQRQSRQCFKREMPSPLSHPSARRHGHGTVAGSFRHGKLSTVSLKCIGPQLASLDCPHSGGWPVRQGPHCN
jgi:hypothetical protein